VLLYLTHIVMDTALERQDVPSEREIWLDLSELMTEQRMQELLSSIEQDQVVADTEKFRETTSRFCLELAALDEVMDLLRDEAMQFPNDTIRHLSSAVSGLQEFANTACTAPKGEENLRLRGIAVESFREALVIFDSLYKVIELRRQDR